MISLPAFLTRHREETPMTNTTETPWPVGVIARYLTVAGATVDLTLDAAPGGALKPAIGDAEELVNITATALCNGCSTDQRGTWHCVSLQGWEEEVAQTFGDARRSLYAKKAKHWAQAHAEVCRALPKPGGAS